MAAINFLVWEDSTYHPRKHQQTKTKHAPEEFLSTHCEGQIRSAGSRFTNRIISLCYGANGANPKDLVCIGAFPLASNSKVIKWVSISCWKLLTVKIFTLGQRYIFWYKSLYSCLYEQLKTIIIQTRILWSYDWYFSNFV